MADSNSTVLARELRLVCLTLLDALNNDHLLS